MAEGRLPNFLIIGVPKAGTTSLASYMGAHPQVFMSAEKELNYFNRKGRTQDWYRANFTDARDALAVGEATPTYILNERALIRMTKEVGDAKLIVIMRNPVDRAYSHYWWNRALHERRPFDAAVRAEMAAGPSDRPLPEEAGHTRYHSYTGGGRYRELLERVERYYPREALETVVLEDLIEDPTPVYQRVCRFLGIDDGLAPENLGRVLNPAYRVRSERLRHWMMRMHAWKRLPFGLADRLDALNRKRLDYAPMDPVLRAELVAWFEPANRALEERLGRELPAWRR